MKILITGASGMLGSMLVYKWHKKAELLACSHTQALAGVGYDIAKFNLLRWELLRNEMTAFAPDWVVHCAALTNVDECEAAKIARGEMPDPWLPEQYPPMREYLGLLNIYGVRQ